MGELSVNRGGPERLLGHPGPHGYARIVAETAKHLNMTRLVLNRLGFMIKQCPDGTAKQRLRWDLERSGVNNLVRQGGRIVLPRVSDVLGDLADYIPSSCPGAICSALPPHFRRI